MHPLRPVKAGQRVFTFNVWEDESMDYQFYDFPEGLPKTARQPPVDDFVEWENGTMSQEKEIEFFDILCNTLLICDLQGCYQRRALELVDAGLITPGRSS